MYYLLKPDGQLYKWLRSEIRAIRSHQHKKYINDYPFMIHTL